MAYISIIIAFVMGYYLGYRNQAKEDLRRLKEKMKEVKDDMSPARIEVIKKKEPEKPETELIKEVEKKYPI